MADKWYEDNNLVRGLGDALAEAGALEDSSDFQQYLRKPQKYNDYYEAWEQYGFPTSDTDDDWDEFVAAIGVDTEDESDEEDGDET